MYCTSCGADNPEGSVFCSVCGARMQSEAQTSQQQYGQPPYGLSPYGQPYGQQPYGQPPKKAKSKAVWFIAGGAVLLVAIALVLIFVVFPGGPKTADGSRDGVLAGSTLQAEFFNDGAEVFSNAFSGMGGVDTKRLMGEPFDIDMKLRAEVSGFPVEIKASATYDEEKLGMLAETMGQEIVLLLDDDTFYVSGAGEVSGYRFDTDEDMSEPMPLKKRATALVKGLTGDADKYTLVIEAMVDNIGKDCFKKGKDKTTLTLTPDDMTDMLKALDERAKKDDDLSDAMKDLDLDIEDAIENMKEEDFDLAVTVGYEGEMPVSLEVDFDDKTEYGAFNLQFGYEDTGDGREISFNITTAGQEIKGTIDTVKDGDEVEYEGELSSSYGGASAGAYSFKGLEEWDGDEVKGSVTVTDNNGSSYMIEYEGTVTFGMPEDKVEDDKRFDVDTKGANVQDMSDLINPSGLGGYDAPEVSVTEAAPAVTEEAAYSERIRVGFAQVGHESDWRAAQTRSIEAAFSGSGYELEIADADNDSAAQMTAVSTFIAEGVDYILLNPISSTGWDTVLTEAKEAGIPVILIDHMIDTWDDSLYITTVGNNYYQQGCTCADALEQCLKNHGYSATDKVNIVTIQGWIGSDVQAGRTNGFTEKAGVHSNWVILDSQPGDFTTDGGKMVMEDFLNVYSDIDVVIAESDNMAFGAIDAIEAKNKTCGPYGDIILISYDAGAAAFEEMIAGKIDADIECSPLCGPCVAQVIQTIEAGGAVEKYCYVKDEIIWAADAATLQPSY